MCFPASSWAASTKAAVKKRTVLLLLGALCLLAALGLTIWNLWTADRAQAAAAAAVQQLEPLIPAPAQQEPAKTTDAPAAEPEEPDIPDYLLNPGMAMPVVMVDGVAYIGVLEIPALELTLPVTGEWSYDRLKIALCRYAGSAYLDNLVIMGHNYPAFFKNLGDLRPGDEIHFTDADGNVFSYTVADLEQLRASQVEDMITGDWDLTLFTCTPGGQLRIAVRCIRAAE